MSKKNSSRIPKTESGLTAAHDVESKSVANESLATRRSLFDSRTIRVVVSIALLAYMAILLLGPLSNPVGSEFLTRPMADFVSPAHRALFLGHGYRFFAPDPGPGHLVVYKMVDDAGNETTGQFPDREKIWPRLMYHRWFMLSETIFQEHSMTPDAETFAEADSELAQQVIALRTHGKQKLSERIARERIELKEGYDRSIPRIQMLVAAVAEHLLKAKGGQQIELFVQERNLPFPVQVLTGDKLNDEKFLSPLTKIGEFRLNEAGEMISLEPLPEQDVSDRENDSPPSGVGQRDALPLPDSAREPGELIGGAQ